MLLRAIQRNTPTPTLLISRFWPKGTTSQLRITGTSTSTGPRVKSRPSALAGMMSSLNSSLRPSAIGCSTPRAPAYSGPIRCCAAAEILRSSQTFTSTPTTAATSTVTIGRGSQSKWASPSLRPKPSSRSRKLVCRSRPGVTTAMVCMADGADGGTLGPPQLGWGGGVQVAAVRLSRGSQGRSADPV